MNANTPNCSCDPCVGAACPCGCQAPEACASVACSCGCQQGKTCGCASR